MLNIPKLLLFTILDFQTADGPNPKGVPNFFYKPLFPRRQAFCPQVLPDRIPIFQFFLNPFAMDLFQPLPAADPSQINQPILGMAS